MQTAIGRWSEVWPDLFPMHANADAFDRQHFVADEEHDVGNVPALTDDAADGGSVVAGCIAVGVVVAQVAETFAVDCNRMQRNDFAGSAAYD